MNKLLMILVAVLVAVCAPLAQAAIVISYTVDGGAAVVCSDAGGTAVLCPNVLGPPLAITFLGASSNTPGGPANSFATSATVDISNNDLATHTIDIFVTAQGFTTPVTPPSVIFASHIGGTVVTGSPANLLSFQSCIKIGSTLPGCPGNFNSAVGTPSIVTGGLGGSFKDDESGLIAAGLTAPFEIGEHLKLTLGAGSNVNFAASTILTPVPEPISIGLLGGVLLLTTRLIRRRASRG